MIFKIILHPVWIKIIFSKNKMRYWIVMVWNLPMKNLNNHIDQIIKIKTKNQTNLKDRSIILSNHNKLINKILPVLKIHKITRIMIKIISKFLNILIKLTKYTKTNLIKLTMCIKINLIKILNKMTINSICQSNNR